MHSWLKETHRLEKIPNLHCSQCDLSSLTNSKTWHTLGLFKISGKLFEIFEWGSLRPVSNFCEKIRPFWGHLTLTLAHRGSQWIYGAFLFHINNQKRAGKLFEIFEWGSLRPVSNFREKIGPFWGHLTLTLGHRGSQWIYGAFLLRLSVHNNFIFRNFSQQPPSVNQHFLGYNFVLS